MNQLEFLELCSIGDVDGVRTALSRNLVDAQFSHKINGWTALHWAAKRGHVEIIRLLLAAGFDPALRNADGKRPVDLTAAPDIENLFKLHGVTCEKETDIPQSNTQAQMNGEKTATFVPSYLKHPPFPHSNGKLPTVTPDTTASKENGSVIKNCSSNPSLDKAKFILIRTCLQDGKEAFKRFTLPGNGSFEFFKESIEKEMNYGRIIAILTLPDRVLLETADQLAELQNLQKVEIVFDSQKNYPWGKRKENEALLVKNCGGDKAASALTRFLPVAILLTGLASVASFLAYRKWR